MTNSCRKRSTVFKCHHCFRSHCNELHLIYPYCVQLVLYLKQSCLHPQKAYLLNAEHVPQNQMRIIWTLNRESDRPQIVEDFIVIPSLSHMCQHPADARSLTNRSTSNIPDKSHSQRSRYVQILRLQCDPTHLSCSKQQARRQYSFYPLCRI